MSDRISPVLPGSRPELAEIEKKIIEERGRISPLYQTLLNAPEIAQGWEALLTAIRNRNSLSPAIREMIILRVAILNRADYEFDSHEPHALKAGVSPEKIAAIREVELPAIFTEQEMLVLNLTDVMTKEIQVSDELFDQVKPHFNDTQRLELVATIAAYNMVSRLLNALDVGH
ncbi:carboxymuconolactone decarboxylase family protein [Polynucleobacter sp. MWH-Aus1W21]|uniref:carboxymuconolactone decarboxylase family protein n=1 Tax=Polynucleobacter sp. MWH-Aus1W21 TaxID=1855880 RepID=UPI001BFDA572|nr:carboxymuconolactone decarboxylase family protein [Polynucleobacter sp. MWH-Aus1W21]QWD66707.1 carboxymuconolactone decarboxylase family protein [Polynucleobacter sp. MWH-Aus1W21]